MMKRFLTFTISISHLLVGITAFAQQTVNYASLGGLVVDPAGEAVAGAFVSARQIETNQTNMATTDSNGRFRFPYLKRAHPAELPARGNVSGGTTSVCPLG
jgi:hypothetical protein